MEEFRTAAVQRVLDGESPEAVIAAIGLSRSCIYTWIARYRAGGWDALRARKAPGRKSSLSPAQLCWLFTTIVTKTPNQLRFPFALWTREIVRALLIRRYGITLSPSAIGRLLTHLGLSPQRPLVRALERDPGAVQRWLKVEYPKIKEEAKRRNALIFFGDEAGVRSDHHAGTTWAPVGKTPVVESSGGRFGLNMISAVSALGSMRFMLYTGKFTADTFCTFLKRLIHHATRPIFLIVDRHSVHTSKQTREFLKTVAGKLELHFLPAYSPDLNPSEQVWRDLKHHGVGRMTLYSLEDLKRKALARLHRLQRYPRKIRGFFLTPTTTYAA
ncbi:MAG: IS630 family transposase [Vulcanimicrobiaceae bacterium]